MTKFQILNTIILYFVKDEFLNNDNNIKMEMPIYLVLKKLNSNTNLKNVNANIILF